MNKAAKWTRLIDLARLSNNLTETQKNEVLKAVSYDISYNDAQTNAKVDDLIKQYRQD